MSVDRPLSGAPTNGRCHGAAHVGSNGQATGLPVSAEGPIRVARYFRWKGVLDRAAAAVLLLPGIPILIALSLLVRLTSRGKSIYRQVRVGKDGKTFMMYKIRTMVSDAEGGCGAVWTQPGDPRVTMLGRALRKLHLDEFPQLFNVLKGDMSLIGPRPERPEFVEILAGEIDGYSDRLLVRPGITGLAQINLPPDTNVDSVRKKLVLDLEYVQHAGVAFDARMFLCTLVRLCGLPGDWAMRLFGLQREVHLEDPAPHEGDLGGEDGLAVNGKRLSVNGNGKAASNGHSNGHTAAQRVGGRRPRRPR